MPFTNAYALVAPDLFDRYELEIDSNHVNPKKKKKIIIQTREKKSNKLGKPCKP